METICALINHWSRVYCFKSHILDPPKKKSINVGIIMIFESLYFRMLQVKMGWDQEFPVVTPVPCIHWAKSGLPFTRKWKKRRSLGVPVTEFQEEMQSRKKAKENTHVSGAEDLFQITLSPQFILPNDAQCKPQSPAGSVRISGPLLPLSDEAPAPDQIQTVQ